MFKCITSIPKLNLSTSQSFNYTGILNTTQLNNFLPTI